LAEVPSVCEHVHLPMQSGSSRTLKRMLRRYTREQYFDCVRRLRDAIPSLNMTTDIIVGFPGETDADFEETLSAVNELRFEDAFTFKFSMREGTPATRLPVSDHVPDAVASERLDRLITAIRSGARERNLTLLGTQHEVLVEKGARRGDMLQARTRDFKTVMIPADGVDIGGYYTVELTGTTGSTFTGTLVAAAQPRRMALPMAAAPALV
jgi:tRNA-2-methylthio-N6-dimethylallyladenosine synthase